jgi:hypothetical protein
MTILTAVGNGLAILPEQEMYLALFHGVRRVAIDCDGEAPARQRFSLSSRPSPAALKRWLRSWAAVRHREAAERTVLTAIAIGAPPAVLAELLSAARSRLTIITPSIPSMIAIQRSSVRVISFSGTMPSGSGRRSGFVSVSANGASW